MNKQVREAVELTTIWSDSANGFAGTTTMVSARTAVDTRLGSVVKVRERRVLWDKVPQNYTVCVSKAAPPYTVEFLEAIPPVSTGLVVIDIRPRHEWQALQQDTPYYRDPAKQQPAVPTQQARPGMYVVVHDGVWFTYDAAVAAAKRRAIEGGKEVTIARITGRVKTKIEAGVINMSD